MSRPTLDDRQRHHLARAVLEAYLDADVLYWLRRARAFAAVGTPECDEIAQACTNRARLSHIVAPHQLHATMLSLAAPMEWVA